MSKQDAIGLALVLIGVGVGIWPPPTVPTSTRAAIWLAGFLVGFGLALTAGVS